jgi:cell division protein FtsZ
MNQVSAAPCVVFGCGRGGSRIVRQLVSESLPAAPPPVLVAADTDPATLAAAPGVSALCLSRRGLPQEGCAGDSARGEEAANACAADFVRHLETARLVVAVAGLGGGAGAGALSVIARLVHERGLPAVFVVTLPLSYEGGCRWRNANDQLAALRRIADTVIAIPCDLLFSALRPDAPADHAFRLADHAVATGVAGLLWAVSAERAILEVDFASLRALLARKPSQCQLGHGVGSGSGRCRAAVQDLLQCPLVGGADRLRSAEAGLVTLVGPADLSRQELEEGLSELNACFGAGARIVAGAYVDPGLDGTVHCTCLACTFTQRPAAAVPAPPRSTTSPGPAASSPAGARQDDLGLAEPQLGLFSGTLPTTVGGVNLDEPTFQRLNVPLDTGE